MENDMDTGGCSSPIIMVKMEGNMETGVASLNPKARLVVPVSWDRLQA